MGGKDARTTCAFNLFRVFTGHSLELFALEIIRKRPACRFDCRKHRRGVIHALAQSDRSFLFINLICFALRELRLVGELILVPSAGQRIEYAVKNNTLFRIGYLVEFIRNILCALRIRNIKHIVGMKALCAFFLPDNLFAVLVEFGAAVRICNLDIVLDFGGRHDFHAFRALLDMSAGTLPLVHAFNDRNIGIL